jgi:hypothetical protein
MIKRSFFKIVTVSLHMIVSFAGCSFPEPKSWRGDHSRQRSKPADIRREERVIRHGDIGSRAKKEPKFGVGVAGNGEEGHPHRRLPLVRECLVAAAGFGQTIILRRSLIASKEAAQLQ